VKGLKRLVSAALVLAVLAVAATPLAAVKPQRINLLEVQRSFVGTGGLDTTSNTPPKIGQGFVLESDYYRWDGRKRGAHFGTLQIVCTFTKIGSSGWWEVCAGAVLLPKGQITLAGSVLQGAVLSVPVVGGTGIYTGAKGYARSKSIGGEASGKFADTIVITG
jgi:hypothetical protein